MGNGTFGYYRLIDWYNSTFPLSDKQRIKDNYNQGMGSAFERWFEGYESPHIGAKGTQKSSVWVLTIFIEQYNNQEGMEDVVFKFMDKVESLIPSCPNPIDVHFYFYAVADFYHRLRRTDPSYRLKYVDVLKRQIAIAGKVRDAMISEWGSTANHAGYFKLIDYYEKEGEYDEAMNVANQSKDVWRREITYDFKNSLRTLIKNGNGNRAESILKLARQQHPDKENSWKRYDKQIKELNKRTPIEG